MSGPGRSEKFDEWVPDSTSRPCRPSTRWLAGALIFPRTGAREGVGSEGSPEAKEVAMKPIERLLSIALALGFLTVPLPSDAQQPGKVYRIGYLGVNAFALTEATHPHKCPMTGA